jgi:hypothetical protein
MEALWHSLMTRTRIKRKKTSRTKIATVTGIVMIVHLSPIADMDERYIA